MSPGIGIDMTEYGPQLAEVHRLLIFGYLVLFVIVAVALMVGGLLVRRQPEEPLAPSAPAPVGPVARGEPGSPRDLTADEMAPVLLARMARLTALIAHPPPEASAVDRRLASDALLSTYRDCEALGLAEQARALLEAARHVPTDPTREAL